MNFIDDEEKMNDFIFMTKEEFLKSYSYLSENEYDKTLYEFVKGKIDELVKDEANGFEDVDISKINLIMQNEKNVTDIYVLVSDKNGDTDYLINIYYPERTQTTPEYDLSYNDFLYEPLANDFRITWIAKGVHPVLWEQLTEEYEPEEIKEHRGIQKYIKYCIDNDITHENVNSNELPCEDILQFYVGVPPINYTPIKFLRECEEMINHNILCYSENFLMETPKEKYKNEWNEQQQKLKIVKKLIGQEIEKLKVGKSFER